MVVVPRLPLAGVAAQVAAASEDALNEDATLVTPGRASARTRNRALLRAKARARRREDREQLASARESAFTGFDTAREVETVWEEDDQTENTSAQATASPFPSDSPRCLHPTRSWRECSASSKLEDAEISECSSEDDSPLDEEASALVAASFSSGHAWEYPLSAAEKKERVMLIFGRTEALSERHIRRCERREERWRAQVRLHRQDNERLRRERSDLCQEAASLRKENRELREKARDLEKRPYQSQQTHTRYSQIASSASRSIAASQPEDPQAVINEDSSPPMTARRLLSSRPLMSSGGSAAAASMLSVGRLSLVTPRSGAARIGTRGSIASVSWAEAFEVPWVAFTSRSTGMQSLYGERDAPEIEESSLSLRRGEYIQSISGSWSALSTSPEPVVARALRIVTSEQQESVAGESAALEDFHFEADHDHEIVGLTFQDGSISGVKQALLAPSRVPSGISSTIDNSAVTRRNTLARMKAVAPR